MLKNKKKSGEEAERFTTSEARILFLNHFITMLRRAVETDSDVERIMLYRQLKAMVAALGTLDVPVDCSILRDDPVVEYYVIDLSRCPPTLRDALNMRFHNDLEVDAYIKIQLIMHAAIAALATVEPRPRVIV